VFLCALVGTRWANCSMGLGLSNNLRDVWVCRAFACVWVCACVHNLMWHLKWHDSSCKGRLGRSWARVEVVYTPKCDTSHKREKKKGRKEGRKGKWHRGWWDLTTFKPVLCLRDYIFCTWKKNKFKTQFLSLSLTFKCSICPLVRVNQGSLGYLSMEWAVLN